MNRVILIVLSILLLFTSCRQTQVDKKLNLADSLLQKELTDSAISILDKIPSLNLKEKDKAYFYLLRGIERYKKEDLSNAEFFIDKSINYYEKKHKYEKLALSYLYKGSIMSLRGDDKIAICYFKKAERLIERLENTDTKIKIFSWLAWENEYHKNFGLAISYGHKTLNEAIKVGNKRWIGYSLELISSVYDYLGNKDSVNYYQEKAFPYIKYQPIKSKITYLGNQASYYWTNEEYDKAILILKQLLKINPTDRTYGQLAGFYTRLGRYNEAETFWEDALKTQDLEQKISLMIPYADWLKVMNREDEAWDVLKQIPLLKDSLSNLRQTEAIKEVQDDFDRKVAEMRHQNVERIVYSGIAILMVVIIAGWQYYRRKVQKARKLLAEKQVLIMDYTARIRQLETDGREKSQETKDLKRKLDTLRDKQAEILYKGKEKFEEIRNGGTTVEWHRSDFNHVVEYYRTINMPFVISLEQDYKSLSASNKFFLLLTEELKFDNDEICRIMNFTDGALRTMRYRIKQRVIS